MPSSEKNATTPDYDAIVHAVQLYVDAFNERSVAKFKEAFHEDAFIFYTDDKGALEKALISDCFEGWTRPHTFHIMCRIISVIQAGDVAVVVLGFDNSEGKSESWVDIHSLLRLDGVWKIMNKTATHNSRAAWAGEQFQPHQPDAPSPPK